MSEPLVLSEAEQDILTELFNIGVGHAAGAMNGLLNEELQLSIPTVKLLPRSSLAQTLGLQAKRICAVHQSIGGVGGMLRANAHLLFPEDKSLELVRLMLGENTPSDVLTEMQQEALCEIGNIILNACVGAMANTLEQHCDSSLPNLYRGTMEQVLGMAAEEQNDISLVIYIDFRMERRDIRSYLVFLLDSISLSDLKVVLATFLDKIGA